jgi:hypothetical protein
MRTGSRIGKNDVDLHIHTKYSDGTCSAQEVIAAAAQKQMRAIAITDHDCIDAYPLVQQLGAEAGIEVIPGVELSSEIQGVDIHILGYFIETDNAAFNRKLQEMKAVRHERAEKIVANLNQQGLDLRFATVLDIAGEGAIGRPHIAAAMIREELVYSFREAFDRYLGYNSPAYVEKLTMHPREVFELIINANGLPVLAHPGITRVNDRIPEFIRDGLAGLEVYHTEHSPEQVDYYLSLCKSHNLACTGGSDFHSPSQSKAEIGVPPVPYVAVESLRTKREQWKVSIA